MQSLEKLNETSSMTMYRIKRRTTVQILLRALKLETNYFTVLINGHKATLTDIVEKGDEILILPRIAGG